jgi:serine/threonine protein phosphatase PrpC
MRILILNEAMPGRPNEDTCGAYSDGEIVTFFVADGAGQRIKTTKTQALFERFGAGTSAARFAALVVRAVFEQSMRADPADVLLDANATLRDWMGTVYGELSAEAMRDHEPQLAPYIDEDPRLFRMALACCVATAARIDLRTRMLDYAHAGDTALLLFHDDGRVSSPTSDQMGAHDAAALKLAQRIQAECGAAHLADVLDDARVREANWRSGLYHNYVDANGQPDPGVGAGILNGLPQLEAYMQRETLPLDGVRGVLVCSDGFLWPAPLDETAEAGSARYVLMRDQIQRGGLTGCYAALRAVERADSGRDVYPRFKIHDDCTAVYVQVSAPSEK